MNEVSSFLAKRILAELESSNYYSEFIKNSKIRSDTLLAFTDILIKLYHQTNTGDAPYATHEIYALTDKISYIISQYYSTNDPAI
jgi:hypothetical protein